MREGGLNQKHFTPPRGTFGETFTHVGCSWHLPMAAKQAQVENPGYVLGCLTGSHLHLLQFIIILSFSPLPFSPSLSLSLPSPFSTSTTLPAPPTPASACLPSLVPHILLLLCPLPPSPLSSRCRSR